MVRTRPHARRGTQMRLHDGHCVHASCFVSLFVFVRRWNGLLADKNAYKGRCKIDWDLWYETS